MRQRLLLKLQFCFVLNISILVVFANADSALEPVIHISVEPVQIGTARLSLGITHAQYSVDSFGNAEAVARARTLLPLLATYQNQHLMGWGALNPEPSPKSFSWSSLDARMALIRETNGIPVLTLCCAPDWMKGGPQGTTVWTDLEKAPLADHFQDYVDLVVLATQRYPDVRYIQVWNEFKGFYNKAENRWDYESYTRLYNAIYDAIKKVNPAVKVGGPYVPVAIWGPDASNPSNLRGPYGIIDQRALDAILYWLKHKHGADFLCVDGGIEASSHWKPSDPFDAAATYYSDVTNWIRSKTKLPIWWSEWYSAENYFSDDKQNALQAVTLIKMLTIVDVALKWSPQGVGGIDRGDQESFWSDVRQMDGGKPFPFAQTVVSFKKCFPLGASIYEVSKDSDDIYVAASKFCTMIVNGTNRTLTLELNKSSKTMKPFEASFVVSQ